MQMSYSCWGVALQQLHSEALRVTAKHESSLRIRPLTQPATGPLIKPSVKAAVPQTQIEVFAIPAQSWVKNEDAHSALLQHESTLWLSLNLPPFISTGTVMHQKRRPVCLIFSRAEDLLRDVDRAWSLKEHASLNMLGAAASTNKALNLEGGVGSSGQESWN